MGPMKRRNALQLVVIGSATPLAAQEHQHAAAATADAAPAKLRFFTPEQNVLVDALSEMIIPADAHSPGAHEAKVSVFIDDLLADAPAETQRAWKSGLEAVDAEATKLHGKPFLACGAAQRLGLLTSMAAGEEDPKTELQRFFVKLKQQTLSGYYTSSVGLLKDLQYKGIVPIGVYPPCEHPDHQPSKSGQARK